MTDQAKIRWGGPWHPVPLSVERSEQRLGNAGDVAIQVTIRERNPRDWAWMARVGERLLYSDWGPATKRAARRAAELTASSMLRRRP